MAPGKSVRNAKNQRVRLNGFTIPTNRPKSIHAVTTKGPRHGTGRQGQKRRVAEVESRHQTAVSG
jgi:hypothetical protein